MGCLVTVFNYISYYLLEAPFHLSQAWIGVISIAYLAGIYSSPKAAQWGFKYGRDKVLPMMLMTMMIGLWFTLLPSLWSILIGLIIFAFSFLQRIRPQVVGFQYKQFNIVQWHPRCIYSAITLVQVCSAASVDWFGSSLAGLELI